MRGRNPDRRVGAPLLASLLAAAFLPGLSVALSQDYILEFPAQQVISYKIEFEVTHPGRLAMEMNWSGNRVISFKLQGPDGAPPTLRRSGPPPLRLYHDVDAELASRPGLWKLSIRGLPSHSESSGELILYLPEGKQLRPEKPTAPTQPRETQPDEPWLRPARGTRNLTPERKRLVETTEQFRIAVIEREDRDSYDWQEQMLRFLAEHRDRRAKPLDPETRLLLGRSAEAVRRVEKLSKSTDPFVVNPPEDRGLYRAWLVLRERRIEPLEMELDSMLHAIHKGHVPELRQEDWFGRFVSCVIACEQHFEERGRLGEHRASNGDIVDEQWDRILLAAEALGTLADVASSEQPRP